VTVIAVKVETAPVLIVKLVVVLPAEIVTVEGNTAALLLLETDTTTPPAGAGVDEMMVPTERLPLTGALGLMVKLLIVTAEFTVILAVPFFVASSTEVAVIVAIVAVPGAV